MWQKPFDDNTFRGKTSVSAEMAIVLVLRCASYNAKEKPIITTPADGSIVPSGTELNVSVAAKGNCNLYLKNLSSYSQIYSILMEFLLKSMSKITQISKIIRYFKLPRYQSNSL